MMTDTISPYRKSRTTCLSLVAATLLLVTGCSADQESDVTLPAVALQVASASMVGTVETRADGDPTDLPHDAAAKIGFYVKADSYYSATTNREGVYSTTTSPNGWIPVAATVHDSIWLNDHTATAAVYYPYSVATHGTTNQELSLTAALLLADGSNDFVWTRFTANNQSIYQSKQIDLVLTHVFSRLHITFTKDASFAGTGQLTALKVAGEAINASAKFGVMTDPAAVNDAAYTNRVGKEVAPIITPALIGADAATTPATFDLLLIPGAQTGTIKVTATIDQKEMVLDVAATQFTGSQLAPGTQYNLAIVLNGTELTTKSLSTANWAPPVKVGGDNEFETN